MNKYNIPYEDLVKVIRKNDLVDQLLKGNFGLEKENVRIDCNGNLALTEHPTVFGDKTRNPYITTDFSESQVEMITPTFDTLEESYQFLENLHNIVTLELEDEYLWPGSMPPKLPSDDLIPIAIYENHEEGRKAANYRKKLASKYGKKKQLICGIHYNFSFKEKFIKSLYAHLGQHLSYKEFKDEIYLKVSRNFLKYGWLLIYLLGTSTGVHYTYQEDSTDQNDLFLEYACSVRNGKYGYKNPTNYHLSYESVSDYVNGMEALMKENAIDSPAEYYNPIRLRRPNKENLLEALKNEGIEYIEIRSIDLNPLFKNGIDLNSLYLIHLFLIYCLFRNEEATNHSTYTTASKNWETVASYGRKENLMLEKTIDEKNLFKDTALEIVDDMRDLLEVFNINDANYLKATFDSKEKVLDSTKTFSYQALKKIKEKGYLSFNLSNAKKYLGESKKTPYQLIGHEDLELSTQILLKDAIKRGIQFEIIDREDNFISLNKEEKKEWVKQATKTSKDSYITFLIMENKIVTKNILERSNIRVPQGEVYTNKKNALKAYSNYTNKAIVIKPKSTNYGIGITIFKNHFTEADYKKAIDLAFNHDETILIEEFISGKEYRFLVIGDEVVGILHRVPANVIGNNHDTIEKLVQKKNQDPLRGIHHRTPLEKIKLGQVEKQFLKEQNKDFSYIPGSGEIVYLRENSNISTGGDSIDFTDDIGDDYKNIAVKAAKAVKARFCGVDMMIQDIKQPLRKSNYSIIELNFNPAIHIHCFPYKGKNRKAGEKVLRELGF